ncbi:MAG: trans-sulfuration enzyme family protein [Solidesulfovibrio sp. DCME]|uniref:trans-sulfuration enzyme family protein n=1 Tax=Solidesulfovibrio sp. DCME TaxID=3447380 RepID=UPI003D0A907C
MDTSRMGEHTRCVRAGERLDRAVGGVTTPIHTAAAYMAAADVEGAYRYPRYGNIPTQEAPAEKIAALEGAQAALVTASGMAAISAALLSVLGAGDHVVLQADLYGGTHRFLLAELTRLGIGFTLVPEADPARLEAAVTPRTRAVYVETPSNPLLRVVDLEGVAAMAQRRGLVSMVDNTFASPINQKPLALGIDLSLHSGTKYLNGHSDLNCGAVAGSRALLAPVRERAVNFGGTLNTYDCFLLERGMKTLALRMAKHNDNAMAVAQFLAARPGVAAVHYPGLPGHPGHDIARRQMRGFGGMLSFTLACPPAAAREFVDGLELALEAVSLGGVETLVCFPAVTSHAKMSRQDRLAVGVTDTLVRLSVGCEDAADIIADLGRALDAAGIA